MKPEELPTPVQAQTLWLSSIGMDVMDISNATGRPSTAVFGALLEAKRKAALFKLRMVAPKPKTEPAVKLGMKELQALAIEAGMEVPL